ncbi:MAG: alkaline phosphatase family protein [Alphaproteobacteria bacterium]
MPRVLVVVFDGLRRDLVSPATTPALARFLDRGTDFPLSRTVFPSETRVAVASLVTGCPPGDHGIVANAFVSSAAGPIQTARIDDLERLAAVRGGRLLGRPSLGERLAEAGKRIAVVSTASPGATYLLNHRAAALGHVTISAHGAAVTRPVEALAAAVDAAGPVPAAAIPNTARLDWAVEVLLRHVVPGLRPDLAVLWLSDPDSTIHYRGIGSPDGMAALAGADAAFGRVLDWVESEPPARRPVVIALSDHGHITTRSTVDLPALVGHAFPQALHQPGYVGGLTFPGGGEAVRAAAARWLLGQPWCGQVLTRGGDGSIGLVPGSFDRRAIGCAHPDAPDLYYVLATDDRHDANGIDGGCLFHGALPVDGSTHGGLHRHELANLLAIGGPGVRQGYASPLPAGTVDVAPTILGLLGIAASDMTGRRLDEAFGDASAAGQGSEEIVSGDRRVRRLRLGARAYLDEAISPVTAV